MIYSKLLILVEKSSENSNIHFNNPQGHLNAGYEAILDSRCITQNKPQATHYSRYVLDLIPTITIDLKSTVSLP